MVRVGEESGTLDTMLIDGQVYESDVEDSVKRALTLLEPHSVGNGRYYCHHYHGDIDGYSFRKHTGCVATTANCAGELI